MIGPQLPGLGHTLTRQNHGLFAKTVVHTIKRCHERCGLWPCTLEQGSGPDFYADTLVCGAAISDSTDRPVCS